MNYKTQVSATGFFDLIRFLMSDLMMVIGSSRYFKITVVNLPVEQSYLVFYWE